MRTVYKLDRKITFNSRSTKLSTSKSVFALDVLNDFCCPYFCGCFQLSSRPIQL